MSPKIDREPVAKGFTIERRTSCGKIYSTITVSPSNKPMEVFKQPVRVGLSPHDKETYHDRLHE